MIGIQGCLARALPLLPDIQELAVLGIADLLVLDVLSLRSDQEAGLVYRVNRVIWAYIGMQVLL